MRCKKQTVIARRRKRQHLMKAAERRKGRRPPPARWLHRARAERRPAKGMLIERRDGFDEQLLAAYAAMSWCVVVYDPTGAIVYANEVAQRFFGQSLDQLRRTAPYAHPVQVLREDGADLPLAERPVPLALRTGAPQRQVTLGLVFPTGERRWVQMAAVPLCTAAGDGVQVVSSFVDITDRRQAEEALRASEARFRGAFDEAAIGMSLVAPSGRMLQVNPALCALLGYSQEELLALDFQVLTHPDDLPPTLAHARRLVDGAVDAGLLEKRYLHRDGHPIWVQLSTSLQRDEAGQPLYFINQVQDVTARKAAEQALEQARRAAEEMARLRQEQAEEAEALAAVSATLAGTLEPTTLYAVILEQATRVLPCEQASVLLYQDGWATVGASWGEPRLAAGTPVFPLQAAEPFWVPPTRTPVSYLPDTAEVETWRDIPPWLGPYRIRSLIAVPLQIDGVRVGSFDVCSTNPHSFTERQVQLASSFGERVLQALRNARLYDAEQQRRRAAEELARLRSDFLAAVSHELRTPLTAIVGFGELLRARWAEMSEAARLEKIEHIVASANRQHRLVQDLLLVGQLENQALAMDCRPVLVAPLVRQAAAEAQGSYSGQRIDLQGPADLAARADAARVVQIIMNLVDNAAKYSPEGSPVAVWWGQESGMVVVRVRDCGPGIPEDALCYLFTRFGRVPGSRIRAGRVGTGLGLYLSRELAQAMGGDLELEATGPQGSTFRLRLPGSADASTDHRPPSRGHASALDGS